MFLAQAYSPPLPLSQRPPLEPVIRVLTAIDVLIQLEKPNDVERLMHPDMKRAGMYVLSHISKNNVEALIRPVRTLPWIAVEPEPRRDGHFI